MHKAQIIWIIDINIAVNIDMLWHLWLVTYGCEGHQQWLADMYMTLCHFATKYNTGTIKFSYKMQMFTMSLWQVAYVTLIL